MDWKIIRCDLVGQYECHREEIEASVRRVFASGRHVLAENVEAFEAEFASYIGVSHAIGVASGTDALVLALECAGIGPNDEVITTPFTAIPTYAAIRRTGAVPVFVDVDPKTFLMDLNRLEGAITSRTRAVIPVHLFGNAVDIEAVRSIVGPSVFILEDCAQAHGAAVRGRKVGSLGDAGAFSFYPTKNLGGYGDGGMITTDRARLSEAVRLRRMYGMINKDEFVVDGVNSRLDEVQAAILRVKLPFLEANNCLRRRIAGLYAGQLPREVVPQAVGEGVTAVHHVYVASCEARRDELIEALEERGIQVNVYYRLPLHLQTGHLRSFPQRVSMPVAEDLCTRVIALPFYPEISDSAVNEVVEAVKSFYAPVS